MAQPYIIGGSFISYSEIFGVRPTLREFHRILRQLHRNDAIFTLIRINALLRHSILEPGRPNFARVQQHLASILLDQTTIDTLKAKVGENTKLDERPLFHPLQMLAALRTVFLESRGTPSASTEKDVRFRNRLGLACLMMNDLFITPAESKRILTGHKNRRIEHLMAQMLVPFELLNAADPRQLLMRAHVLYRVLLPNPDVAASIKHSSGRFDIAAEFERHTGLALSKWLHLVFGIYAAIRVRSIQDLIEHPEYAIVDRQEFIRESQITQEEMDLFLATISSPIDDFRRVLKEKRPADWRYDIVPFRSTPLIELSTGRYACTDIALLMELMHTGVHWIIHKKLPNQSRERRNLFAAWGELFHAYVEWLLEPLPSRMDLRFQRSPRWSNGSEAFDGLLIQRAVCLPLEYKGGFLDLKAKHLAKPGPLLANLDKKFVTKYGVRQLVVGIAAACSKSGENTELPRILLSDAEVILPVMIVQEHALRGLQINWYLNRRFSQAMRRHQKQLRKQLQVRPLSVVQIEDLEAMVEAAESSDFNPVYALHNRTVRDPDMQLNLRNFLVSEAKNFGEQKSPRLEKIYEELLKEMSTYMFGDSGGKGEKLVRPD